MITIMFTKRQILYYAKKQVPVSDDGVPSRKIRLQNATEDFELNAFGFPLNDIAALNGAKSIQEYNAIVSKLNEYVANNPDNSKMSVKDLIATVSPRSFQTPSELDRAAQWIGSHWQNKLDTLVSAKHAVAAKKAAEMEAAEAAKQVTVTTTTSAPATTT